MFCTEILGSILARVRVHQHGDWTVGLGGHPGGELFELLDQERGVQAALRGVGRRHRAGLVDPDVVTNEFFESDSIHEELDRVQDADTGGEHIGGQKFVVQGLP
jgi:hypothetical protein